MIRRKISFAAAIIVCLNHVSLNSIGSTTLVELPASRIAGTWSSVTGIPSALICCSYCLEQQTCFCVNYNKVEELCVLVTEDVTRESEATPDPAWTVFYILLNIADVPIKSYATASQSSDQVGYPSRQAIDGNYLSDLEHGTCIHTFASLEEWWKVNFEKLYHINGIIVWNRIDCCAERFSQIQILISKSLSDPPELCASYPGPPPASNTINITCTKPMEGKTLKIMRTNPVDARINFCEVDFY